MQKTSEGKHNSENRQLGSLHYCIKAIAYCITHILNCLAYSECKAECVRVRGKLVDVDIGNHVQQACIDQPYRPVGRSVQGRDTVSSIQYSVTV